MRKLVSNILIFYSCVVTSVSIHAAGFATIEVEDQGQPDLQVGLWYPSIEQPPADPNTKFGLSVALDAPLQNPNGGLVVISHGYSGWYAGHADTAAALADAGFIVAAPTHTGNTWSDMSSTPDKWTLDRPRHISRVIVVISHGYSGWYAGHADTAAALADAGFIVAAPTHTGNTWSDMSSTPDKWTLDRPRHISRVIDHMLGKHEYATVIDEGRIGVYGFSAGGYTAVGLIGGVPDFKVAAQHCEQQPKEYVCAEGLIDALISTGMESLPDEAWGHDTRISAAAISAPALGFAYTEDSLSTVTADVQLWSGQLDTSVPTESNAALLAQRLPVEPETHYIEDANHFAFLIVPCRESFKQEDPEEYEIVCGDADGFDRHQFLDDMQVEIVRFFESAFEMGE